MAKKHICGDCGEIINPAKKKKGSVIIFILLLFLGIFPGLIYLVWMMSGRETVCPKCQSGSVFDQKSPRGQKLLAEYHS